MATTVSLAESMAGAVPALLRRFAETVPGAVVTQRPGATAVITGAPLAGFNVVTVTGSSRPDLMQAVRDAERADVPFLVQTRTAYLSHVVPVLAGMGLREVERLPGMVSIIAPQAPRPPELALVRVDAPSTLTEFAETLAAGFGMPVEPVRELTTPALVEAPGIVLYVGYVDGRPVATATGVTDERGVGVVNVATVADARGRGYGTAITARAVADGFATGAGHAWLQATPAGVSVYRRMGFVEIDEWVVFGRPVPAQRPAAD